jgi:hypothetical protein
MNRTIRTGLLSFGIAVFVMPVLCARTQPRVSATASTAIQASTFADGTQPPAPNGPVHPPSSLAWSLDGTQPPAPNGPIHRPPSMARFIDGTQPPAPNGPIHRPPSMARFIDGTQPPAPNGPVHPPIA